MAMLWLSVTSLAPNITSHNKIILDDFTVADNAIHIIHCEMRHPTCKSLGSSLCFVIDIEIIILRGWHHVQPNVYAIALKQCGGRDQVGHRHLVG